jgi:hypothetical protein
VITWVRIPYNLLTTKRTRKCEEVYLILWMVQFIHQVTICLGHPFKSRLLPTKLLISFQTLCRISTPRTSKSNCFKRRSASQEQHRTCFFHLIWVLTRHFLKVVSRNYPLQRGLSRALSFHSFPCRWGQTTNKS